MLELLVTFDVEAVLLAVHPEGDDLVAGDNDDSRKPASGDSPPSLLLCDAYSRLWTKPCNVRELRAGLGDRRQQRIQLSPHRAANAILFSSRMFRG